MLAFKGRLRSSGYEAAVTVQMGVEGLKPRKSIRHPSSGNSQRRNEHHSFVLIPIIRSDAGFGVGKRVASLAMAIPVQGAKP